MEKKEGQKPGTGPDSGKRRKKVDWAAVHARRRVRWGHFVSLTNAFFFLLAAFAAVWLVALAAMDDTASRWTLIAYVVLLWGAIAYIFLPRVYRLITNVFVPDYFIGRAKTDSGLLGDVVNMAWDGPAVNIHRAMQAAGWTLAAPITFGSSVGIVKSVLFHKPDRDAPVSPLFLFGRQQDFAYEMDVDGSADRRHHIRFWKCPPGWPLPGGRTVEWLAAASFDKGVRLSGFTLQVTHSISGDVDAERDFTLKSIEKVDPGVRISWIDKFSTAFHARNGGGDWVHTDGNLPIVDLESLPPSIPQLSAEQVEEIAAADPPTPTSIAELRKQTHFPASLILAAVVTAAVIVRDVVDLIRGTMPDPVLTWGVVVGLLVTLIAMMMGRSWGRFLMMVVYGVVVINLFGQWLAHDLTMSSAAGVLHVAIATAMLLVLSSEAVTEYTNTFTKWRQAHRRRDAGV